MSSNTYQKKKKTFSWHKGGGELLAFSIVMPMLVFLIYAVASIAIITITQQQLMFAAYSATRIAVVQDNEAQAHEKAAEIVTTMFPQASLYKGEGSGVKRGSGGSSFSMKLLAENPEGGSSWKKGNMLLLSVSKDVRVFMPFSSGVYTQSITMMVENSEERRMR